MRLDKFLANAGCGTRTEVKQLIKKGRVTVNGETVKKADMKIDHAAGTVAVNGEVVLYEPVVYLMLNKPQGVISATEDARHDTVVDLLPDYRHYDLHPVGRLDKDTEGLLILTNDGQFSHEVLSPRKHVDKTYYARIDGRVTAETITQFNEGLILDDGYKTMPARLKIVTSGGISEVEVTIQEGKFHQVKRMFSAVGMTVSYLQRIQMGGLPLDRSLQPGQYKLLTAEDINRVKNK
ncbi:rRNA pseudouridine synthase [Macrococcus equipercicus]|uniref:Pseudouridine synthase n=1 Tax=Macrococcus equipercicus TaxID=69967 RepID=A0ABQ6R7E6_9STAP|nr:pseudouridine synthase [Macrococcus equipercicus]KAA1038395.1 rRNA pseudouridine synthase [Macrococcus equipercicus]